MEFVKREVIGITDEAPLQLFGRKPASIAQAAISRRA
jgi:hypothetical protein